MPKPIKKSLSDGYLLPAMHDEADQYEPFTLKRVRKRLSILIEVMPTSRSGIYGDKLLSNIKQYMIEIRAAIDYLQQRNTGAL